MDCSYDNWPAILHNIKKSRQVWGQLGKILQRKRGEPTVSAKSYCAVVQMVLLFGV